jgi:hypothetical protein
VPPKKRSLVCCSSVVPDSTDREVHRCRYPMPDSGKSGWRPDPVDIGVACNTGAAAEQPTRRSEPVARVVPTPSLAASLTHRKSRVGWGTRGVAIGEIGVLDGLFFNLTEILFHPLTPALSW